MNSPGPYRLKAATGAASVGFRFNGQAVRGITGDTVASALLANGFRVVARSFKFHRPRGIFSAGYEEPNALVQLHSGAHAIPCARATLVPVSEGLEVSSEVGWPNVRFDALRMIDCVHSVFAAGFYNKMFMWPSWHVYEPIIRKLSGFGRVPTGPDPDRYETRHVHCDVLVIGGGSAGIQVAKNSANDGARVILVEQQESFDGDLSWMTHLPNVTALPSTSAVGYYDHSLVTLVQAPPQAGDTRRPRERLWMVRARRVILATGAIEQPLVFCNNDRPGIMLAGAALKFLRRHSIAPGRRVVLATNNDSAYLVARELKEAGVNVVALADSREAPPAAPSNELSAMGVRILRHSLPADTQGFAALKGVTLSNLGSRRDTNCLTHFACDALLVSGGWSPTLHLFAQAGGKLTFCESSRSFEACSALPNIEIVGAAANPSPERLGERISSEGDTARQWVDLRHDVTVADIELSVRENFSAVEHIKRYTTLGMSGDQGKVGQAPSTEVIARVRRVNPSDLGPTTFRPPFVPVTLGTMVGRNVSNLYAPIRRTSLYSMQVRAGGSFEDFGEWQRAVAFPRTGESLDQAITREVRTVRNCVGIYDASPLGKIELAGPDALEFADRFYMHNLATLKQRRARYSIMLRESGVIFDDGTVVVLDSERVLLTTTSTGAARVAQWLEEWLQCEWPMMRVVVVPVTDQWSTIALTGQHARVILERLKPECDLSGEVFPHLGFRATRLFGTEARIYRVSFSGELTYEINVHADKGPELWSALLEEGRSFGIAPFGVEALLHMRVEKGFLHVGTDTDGTTVPDDVGLGKPAAAKKSHYIGKRSLTLPENVRSDRLQLIGLIGCDGMKLPVGSHLRLPRGREATDGWITSAGTLSTDGTPIAMAMLRSGRSQIDQIVTVHDAGGILTNARVVNPVFYDPSGARTHG